MNPNGNGQKPTHQIVKVHPARERERVHGTQGKPMFCFIVGYTDPDQPKPFTLAKVPVTFDDMGHPSDVVVQMREGVVVTSLDFIWRGQLFEYPLHPTWVPMGETLHLALGHMKLKDRFGTDVLDAGRN